MLIKMSSFLSDFYPILYNFFEIFKFENGKCEISPKSISRTLPVTVNFPVNRIYRSKFFSMGASRRDSGAEEAASGGASDCLRVRDEQGIFYRPVNPNRMPPVPVYRTGWTGNQ